MTYLTMENLQALSLALPEMETDQQQKALDALNGFASELARKHYWFYVWFTSLGHWKPGKFHLFLCREVQAFLEKKTDLPYEILIIEAPPQHGKSVTVTEAAPSWCAGIWPDRRIILNSYNDDSALRFGKANRDKLKEFNSTLFGIEVDPKRDRADEFGIKKHNGRTVSRGFGSGITGNTADFLFIDDPIKSAAEADSEGDRERKWTAWNTVLKPRLTAHAKVVLIMTRWHEDDLAGRILKNEPAGAVTEVRVPCEAEANDPLGRALGDALAPEIGKDGAWLREFRKGFQTASGIRAWNALFQGRPTSMEGNMLKRAWWKRYRTDRLPQMARKIISVDAAFKDGEGNDFVSIQLWGKYHADYYLIDRDCRRLDFPATLQAIRGMVRRHGFTGITLIEDKANGSAVIQVLRRELSGIVPVNPEGGKVARVNAVSHLIEAGNVWLPHEDDCPWVAEFIAQCAAFPNGKHDDDVDAMSQALNRLRTFDASEDDTVSGEDGPYDDFFKLGT